MTEPLRNSKHQYVNPAPQSVPVWIRRILCLIVFLSAPAAQAQIFEVGIGTSTLFQATGASLEIYGPGYQSSFGLGSLDGHFRFGVSYSKKWNGSVVTFGDTIIPLQFSTDVFGGGQYFLGRGLEISRTKGRFTLIGFAGTTAVGFNAPFFRGAQSENGVGAFLLDAKLTQQLHLFSRTILSNRQTLINGIEWQPDAWLRASIAGGVGANQGYMASSVTFDRPWVTLKGSYVLTGDDFRRIVVQSPLYAETDRGNISVTLHPVRFFNFTTSHSNLLEPTGTSLPAIRATLDQFSGSVVAAQFRFSAALFRSTTQGRSSQGTTASVGRDFAHGLQASVNYFDSRSEKQKSSTTLLSSLRETISPRLSLLQTVTRSDGHTTAAFGGDLLTNPVAIGVSYQTVYSPFRTGNQFRQVLLLNVGIQAFGNAMVNLSSYVAPDGSVKYATYGKTYISSGDDGSLSPAKFGFAKYLVSGRVVDEKGQPVDGAAIRVNGVLVFTNSAGEFFVRSKRAKRCSLEVMLGEFLTPLAFDVVSQPVSVTPSREGSGTPVVVTLRHRHASS
jgi:hypothetical protein